MHIKLADVWGFFVWVFMVCMLAGVVSVIGRLQKTKMSILEIFGEIFVSGFVGLMTFLLCVGIGFITLPPQDLARAGMVSFLCGMFAHSSTRTLALYDYLVRRRFGKILGVECDPPQPLEEEKIDVDRH